jgi:hypothetical protein
MSREWSYDLESVDLEDCGDIVVLPIPAKSVPAVIGTLEALTWRRRHVSDASHAVGVVLYERIMEVWNVNECIVDALNEIASKLAYLECICDGISSVASGVSNLAQRLPDIGPWVDLGDVTFDSVGDTMGAPTVPSTDNERCELAQAIYLWWFDTFTTTLLPAAGATGTALVGVIVTVSAFAAVASFVALPAVLLSAIFGAVVAWGISGSVASFENWLLASKDEIVCILYNNIPDYGACVTALHSWIDSQSSPSFLDKQVFKSMVTEWHMTWIAEDQQENETWDAYLVAGQCGTCGTILDGCVSVVSYSEDDWVGGSWYDNWGPLALGGGTAYWNEVQRESSETGDVVRFYWYPRDFGSIGFAVATWGVWDWDLGVRVDFGETPQRAIGVLAMEEHAIPATQVPHRLSLWIKGETNGIQTYAVCFGNYT